MSIAILCALGVLTGCDDTNSGGGAGETPTGSGLDGNKFEVLVDDGSKYNNHIDEVKVFVNGSVVATGEYANGGFVIELPNSVDNALLSNVVEYWDLDELPPGVTVSGNEDAGVNDAILVAYKSGVEVGDFYCEYESETKWAEGALLYIESDLSFTGSFTDEYEGETYTVSVSLKEGWNLYYSQEEVSNSGYKATLTTKVPNGIKWYFESNGNNPGGGGDSGIGNDPSIVVANSVVNANPNIATVRVTANAELGYNLKSSSRMSFGSSKMNLSRTNIKSAMCSVRQFASTGELIADSSNFWR